MSSLKVFLTQSLVSASLIVCVSPAMAETTWMPKFQPHQNVYIDPKLSQNPTYPVSLAGLEQQIQQAARHNDLTIYVVAAQQGTETLPPATNWAMVKLDDLVARWQTNPDFPTDKHLTIFWIRRADNVSQGWVAANSGTRLQTQGLTAEKFSDPNGPVIPALKQYMPVNPQQAILTIVNNANREIDRHELEVKQKAEQARRAFQQQQQIEAALAQQLQREAAFRQNLLENGVKGSIALGGLGIIIWLAYQFSRQRSQALAEIERWQNRLNSANELYLKLYDRYFGFLKGQSDWATKFQGETLTRYQVAVSDFTEFTVRLEAANQRLKAAKTAVDRSIFPIVAGFHKAIALLTTEAVEITGQELPLEMADLFGGVVAKTTYEPEQLLAAMSQRFKQTNQALAEIVKAFNEVETKQQRIATLFQEIETATTTMTATELRFEPYAARWQHVQQQQQELQAIVDSDPLTAYVVSQTVEAEAQLFKADLERSLALKNTLAEDFKVEIAKAVDRTRTVRAQMVNYQYSIASEEVAPTTNSSAKFTLQEDGGNPDAVVAAAERHRAAAWQALLLGQIDRANAEVTNAIASAGKAYQLVDTVLAAKSFVEKQVPIVRANLNQLSAEIPAATVAIVELEADFLPENLSGEPEKLNTTQQAIATIPNKLAQLKQAYDEQRYLWAKEYLISLERKIQTSRSNLAAIHAHLAKLRQLRQQSREIVATYQKLAGSLQQKLHSHSFTTAPATNDYYQHWLSQLKAQTANVAQKMTNWLTALDAANQLVKDFKSIDTAIDEQLQQYQQAVQSVTKFCHVVTEAESFVKDTDTRKAARQKFTAVKSTVLNLQTAIAQPQSNWKAIAWQADERRELAIECRNLAQKDRLAADKARSAIEQAETKIRDANCYYGHGVRASLGSANSLLANARNLLRDRSYEAAKQKADEADRAAQTAQSAAQKRVAAIEAKEEARCREQARTAAWMYSNSSTNSSSSSYSSYSGSYDSGGSSYSGGGSYGGDSGGGSYGGGSGGGGY